MNLEVICRHCHKHYLVNIKYAGRKVKCRHCRQAMQVGARGQGPGARDQESGTTELFTDPLNNTLFDCRLPSDEETRESFDWGDPADWRQFARDWVDRHGLQGTHVMLVAGPSPQNPAANHRIEFLPLTPHPTETLEVD